MNKKALGQILKAMKAVSDDQLREGLQFAEQNSCRLGEALVQTGACNQGVVSRALAKHWGLPFANLSKGEIKKEIIAMVPKEVAMENAVIPVAKRNGTLIVAMEALDFMVLDNLRFLLNGDEAAKPKPAEPVAKPAPKRPARDELLALRSEVRRSEERVEKLTEMLEKLDVKLADPALYNDPHEAKKWSKKRAEAVQAMARAESLWMAALEKLEGAEKV